MPNRAHTGRCSLYLLGLRVQLRGVGYDAVHLHCLDRSRLYLVTLFEPFHYQPIYAIIPMVSVLWYSVHIQFAVTFRFCDTDTLLASQKLSTSLPLDGFEAHDCYIFKLIKGDVARLPFEHGKTDFAVTIASFIPGKTRCNVRVTSAAYSTRQRTMQQPVAPLEQTLATDQAIDLKQLGREAASTTSATARRVNCITSRERACLRSNYTTVLRAMIIFANNLKCQCTIIIFFSDSTSLSHKS